MNGVGAEMAGRIWDHFGRVPWRWEVGVNELMKVKGVGRTRAERMLAAFQGDENGEEDG
jgi:ERCC4-type nuclease